MCIFYLASPGGSDGKESTCNLGNPGSIPESGRSPGEGSGNPLQYSCLGNPWTEKTGRLTIHGVAKELDMTWQLNSNNDAIIRAFQVVQW